MSKDTDIFGMAILDYLNGDYTEDIKVSSSIADEDVIPIPYLFRTFEDMPAIEQKALGICQGKILDVGCGAGGHALYLQQQNHEVTAIDTSQGAIQACNKRGLKNAIHISLLDFKRGKYDTILLLMNGTGIFGTLKDVVTYLEHLKSLLALDGQIIIDSSDLIYMYEEEDGSYLVPSQYYYGEVNYTLRYKQYRSPSFDWLYIHFDLLREVVATCGLTAKKILEGPHYDYLAVLTRQ